MDELTVDNPDTSGTIDKGRFNVVQGSLSIVYCQLSTLLVDLIFTF